jgi:hypothetical protein
MSDTMQAPIGGELEQSGNGSGGNRRLLVALAALAGVLVIGAAVYFLFLSGDSSDDELAAVPRAQATGTHAPKANKGDDGVVGDKVPEEFKGNIGRDPFAPLAFELVSATPTEAPTTEPTDGTGGTTPTTDPQPTATSDPGTTTAYVVEVKSVDVAKNKANIAVNDKLYTVKTGEVFPSSTTGPFKVLRLGAGTAKVLFGSDLPVILKQGSPVTFGSF